MEAYFDNAATTRVCPVAKECVLRAMEVDYGNPSSLHKKGIDAERYIRTAQEQIAKELKVLPKEILFTSGGTESNNLALLGTAFANQRMGKHIITTRIEHASVYNPVLYLRDLGFDVTFIEVNKQGIVELDTLKKALRTDTIIVSIMFVNNEIGSIQPIEAIGQYLKETNPKTVYHVDAIQGFGKLRMNPKKSNIDLLSVSGHKIHGPKGTGFLYIQDKTKIKPILYGGGQQKNMRSGTENVPGIAGLGAATEWIYQDHQKRITLMKEVKETFLWLVLQNEDVQDNSGLAPHIASVSFRGIRSEVLLHALEERGVYCSAGSACSSNHPAISGTLQAIQLDKELLDATLRFSFSAYSTVEEAEYAAAMIAEIVPILRKFTRR